jgi:hypothetical protein
MLGKTGGWSIQKTSAKVKGYQALVAVGKHVPVTPNIKVYTLESVYEIVCECKSTYGVKVWGLNEA